MVSFLRRLAEHTVPLVAVVLLMGGSAVAGGLITGNEIEDGSITGKDIKDGSLTPADFRQLLTTAAGNAGQGQTGKGPGKGVGGSPSCRTLALLRGGRKCAARARAPSRARKEPRAPKARKVPRACRGSRATRALRAPQAHPGAPGNPGAPGAPAVFDTEQVVKTTGKSTETPKELQVTCPNGPVLSGGYVLAGQAANPSSSLIARRSYAVAQDTWLVRAVNAGPSEEWELTVVATCATG